MGVKHISHIVFRVLKGQSSRKVIVSRKHAQTPAPLFPKFTVGDLDGTIITLDPAPVRAVPAYPCLTYRKGKK